MAKSRIAKNMKALYKIFNYGNKKGHKKQIFFAYNVTEDTTIDRKIPS